MKIASAQLNSTIGDIQMNLEKHYHLIDLAIQAKVQLITFPEMSVTGYCRKEGNKLAFTNRDTRLNKLIELSVKGKIIIVAGAPISIDKKLYIGSFIFYPNKTIAVYTKQYLHEGEEKYYAPSINYNPIINLDNEKIALAICADINNENHPFQAQENKCSVYLPSIFFSKTGVNSSHQLLEKYAQKYSLNILMSNYTGKLWGMEAGGKSAFWNSDGELLDSINSNDSGILIAEKNNTLWKTNFIKDEIQKSRA